MEKNIDERGKSQIFLFNNLYSSIFFVVLLFIFSFSPPMNGKKKLKKKEKE
jgi:hypothetical protein